MGFLDFIFGRKEKVYISSYEDRKLERVEKQKVLNRQWHLEALKEAEMDYKEWKMCYDMGMLYDPSRMRYFGVMFFEDGDTMIDKDKIRQEEFNKLQQAYLSSLKSQLK